MKTLLSLLLFFLCFTFDGLSQVNPNSTYVNGYYRSNGTYVQGHYRTTPNSTINDNYSTYPNVNPYTGKQGTVTPTYSAPSYSTPSYSTPSYSTPTYTKPSYSTPSYSTKRYRY